jgi:hypothetical protein
MIRRYFGTHRYYYDYRYSKTHPELTRWEKCVALAGDMKLFLRRFRPGKKEDL